MASTAKICALMTALIMSINLAGCDHGAERSVSPETIDSDFRASPMNAVEKYRGLLHSNSESKSLTTADRVTIAGELINFDRRNYDEYYKIIASGVDSKDQYVAAAAANSLRNAKGEESLSFLFRMIESENPVVARAAAHAIKFRLTNQQNVSIDNQQEGDESIVKQVSQACSGGRLRDFVRSVMCAN